MRLYLAPSRPSVAEHVHVPAMGLREVMPPGLIRYGGPGSRYPVLIMAFHSPAWVLNPDGTQRRAAGRRLVIWGYEAYHHYGHDTARWDHSWLRAGGRWIDRAVRSSLVPLGVPLDMGSDGLALRYLRMIYDELHGHARQDPDMLEGLLRLFLYDVARRHSAQPAPRRPDARLEAARRFLEARFDQPFNLAATAAQAHLSRSHFCFCFTRQFGVPPRAYAMRLRLHRAAQLLTNHEFAVYQVAQMVGCDDPFYFSRLFRKHYGQSPAQFRRLQNAR
jgi:AraC-like DNA-binding protein